MKQLLLMALLVPSFSYSMDFAAIMAEEMASGGASFTTAYETLLNASPAASELGLNIPKAGGWTPFGVAVSVFSYGASAYSAYHTGLKIKKDMQEAKEAYDECQRVIRRAQQTQTERLAEIEEQNRRNEARAEEQQTALNFLDDLDLGTLRDLARKEQERNSVCTVFRDRYRAALEEAGFGAPDGVFF